VVIRLTPALAFRLVLLKDDAARADVEVEGDAALALRSRASQGS
jgi:hypothetical protein